MAFQVCLPLKTITTWSTTSSPTSVCRPRRQLLYCSARPLLPAPTDTSTEVATSPSQLPPQLPSQPPSLQKHSETLFSNLAIDSDGKLSHVPVSELSCTALVAGTMIGAGVLALPTVAAPSGFIPSSAALLAIWAYMSVTGLLISEVTVNTACSLGRPTGISALSLSSLTLGRPGVILTAGSYLLLHYAILTAYTSQGSAMFFHLLSSFSTILSLPPLPSIPSSMQGLAFASAIGAFMYYLPARSVELANNAMVLGALVSFAAVMVGAAAHFDIPNLLQSDWTATVHGGLIPVLFVSCVYHNVVSTITMRLEGDRTRIRRVILLGSGLPIAMFIAYDAAVLGGGALDATSPAVAIFSVLAIATSFVGFVEGLTELFSDARATIGQGGRDRWPEFAATIAPPVVFASLSPDAFLRALDVAGTYGIAVLFGVIPAAMAWQTRRDKRTSEFQRYVGGGGAVLGVIAAVPFMLIGSRVWGMVSSVLGW